MKTWMTILAAAALGAAAARGAGSGVLLDSYAAMVSGKVITVGDVLDAMRAEREELALSYDGAELNRKLAEAFAETRDRLIEAQLALAEFRTAGGEIPERAIEDHVNGVIREQFGNDRGAFLRALGEARLTYTEWREQMKEQLILQAMRQQAVTTKVQVAPLDVQERYERDRAKYTKAAEVRLRLFVVPKGLRRQIDLAGVASRLQSGAMTVEAAAKHFRIELQDGEELVELGSLQKGLRRALDGAEAGDVVGPVNLDGTDYLVEVLERSEERTKPLAEVREGIEEELRKEAGDRLYAIWMNTLRAKHYVQIYKNDLFR